MAVALGLCLLLAACGGPSMRQVRKDFERVYPGAEVAELKPSELDLSGYTYTVAFRRGDEQLSYAEFSYVQDKKGKWTPREEVREEPGVFVRGRGRWRRDGGTTGPIGARMMGRGFGGTTETRGMQRGDTQSTLARLAAPFLRATAGTTTTRESRWRP